MKKIIILISITILLGLSYILPDYIFGTIFIKFIAFFVNIIGFLFGPLFLICISIKIIYFFIKNRKNRKFLYLILVCWLYNALYIFLVRSNKYISEAIETLNMDRGDILPHLPAEHRMVGFFINSLLYLLPVFVYIWYQSNIEDEKKLELGSDN